LDPLSTKSQIGCPTTGRITAVENAHKTIDFNGLIKIETATIISTKPIIYISFNATISEKPKTVK